MDDSLSPFEERLARRLQGYVASRVESTTHLVEAGQPRRSLAPVLAVSAVLVAAVATGLALSSTLPDQPSTRTVSPAATTSNLASPTDGPSPSEAAKEPTTPAASPGLPISDCRPIPPVRLADGSKPGEARRSVTYPNAPVVEWGTGENLVVQFAGHRSSFDPADPPVAPHTSRVSDVRGHRALLIVAGDPPMGPQLGLPSIGWLEDGCPYIVYVSIGNNLDKLDEFAQSY